MASKTVTILNFLEHGDDVDFTVVHDGRHVLFSDKDNDVVNMTLTMSEAAELGQVLCKVAVELEKSKKVATSM